MPTKKRPIAARLVGLMRSKNAKPDIRTVLADIMGLTKINYNSCNFNDGLPVTVRFARMVGDVLIMGAAKGEEKQPFKFYV
jgi:hypothetical protein